MLMLMPMLVTRGGLGQSTVLRGDTHHLILLHMHGIRQVLQHALHHLEAHQLPT